MPVPVLFMIQNLDQGGTEHHFFDLVSGLDRTRFTPHVIYCSGGYVSTRLECECEGLPIRQLPVTRAYDLSGFIAIRETRRYLKRHKIAVIFTFHFVADFVGTLASLRLPTRVISSRRDMGFTRTSRQKFIGRHLNHWVDRYIAVSDGVRQIMAVEEGIDPSKTKVVYNGIDLNDLHKRDWNPAEERARHAIAPDDIVITCVANFNPVKGHLNLIEAFARLKTQHKGNGKGLKLILAGDGPLRSQIEQSIQTQGLQNSILLMGRSKDPVREFLMGDLAVLASDTEGFSNAIVQAMALRRPVVACRVGGNPEAIVEGQTGYLVPPSDPVALAEALDRLIQDAPLRQAMGEKGCQRAQELFRKEGMVRKTESIIESVLR